MLHAGTAADTINPEPGINLWGFPNLEERANTGVDRELEAKALYLAAGNGELVVITADLLGLNKGYVARIRDKVTAATGIPASGIMVASSHTHSAPLLEKTRGKNVEPDTAYIDGMLDTLAVVAAKAKDAAVPAKLGFGSGEADLCHNRRVLDDAGKASSGWEDHAHEHSGITDKRVFVLKVTKEDGGPLAIVANYACHPVVMGPPNFKVSSDYPGYMKAYLERELPGGTAFFTNAGGGDINPYVCIGAAADEARKMGEALGAEVLRVASGIVVRDVDTVGAVSIPVSLDMRPGMLEAQQTRLQAVDGKIAVEVQVATLGDVLLVTAPGELLVSIAMRMKRESGVADTMVVAYANDYAGYLPQNAIIGQGGYEVTSAVSHDVEEPFVAAMQEGIARLAHA